MRLSFFMLVIPFLATAAGAPAALAQWTATLLTPQGAQEALGLAGAGPLTVGSCVIDEVTSGGYWTGGPDSWTSLMPAGFTWSLALGARGSQQVGSAAFPGGQEHAALWHGSSASFVDLAPPGSFGSRAVATSGAQQVGATYTLSPSLTRVNRACLWNGTPESWVDLHPSNALFSWAFGTDGVQQVGYVGYTNREDWQAALWTGTPSSLILLTPPGASHASANAVSGGRQVGHALFPASGFRAGMWTGSAASFVPFPAPGLWDTGAIAFEGDFVAGWAVREGEQYERAAAWVGPGHTYVDLAQFLPGPPERWGTSTADAVWIHHSTVFVAGKVVNLVSEPPWEAVLWTLPLCGTADFNGDGDVGTDQDIAAFFACLSGNCCAACFSGGADFNGDGDFGTDADIESFFRVLGGGNC